MGRRGGRNDLAQEGIDLGQHLHNEPPMGDQRMEVLREAGSMCQALERGLGLLAHAQFRRVYEPQQRVREGGEVCRHGGSASTRAPSVCPV